MRVLVSIARLLAQAVYELMKLRPVEHKVVLISRQSNQPSKDFSLLMEALRAVDDAPRVVVLCREVGCTARSRFAYAGEMLRQMYQLSTARVAVLDGYIAPVSLLRHRRELTVVQMWHALGAMKRFGFQTLDRPGGRSRRLAEALRMHRNYDVVLCGSQASAPFFAEAFGVDIDRVRPLGLPRVDYLLESVESGAQASEDALDRLRARHARLKRASKTVVLYAPTFRRGGAPPFAGVAEAFDPEIFTVLMKPHDLDGSSSSGGHVVDVSGEDVLELLLACDIVVTDYSAVAFEASLLDRPIYFDASDIEDYRRDVGLNVDPMLEFPTLTAADPRGLAERIVSGTYDGAALQRFRDRYAPFYSTGCTDGIAGLVREALGPS